MRLGTVTVMTLALTGWAGAASAQTPPATSFDLPIAGFDLPIVGFDNPLAGFQEPLVGVSDPFAGFQEPLVGLRHPVVSAVAALALAEGAAERYFRSGATTPARQSAARRVAAELRVADIALGRSAQRLRGAKQVDAAQRIDAERKAVKTAIRAWQAKKVAASSRAQLAASRSRVTRAGSKSVRDLELKAALAAFATDLARVQHLGKRGKRCVACVPAETSRWLSRLLRRRPELRSIANEIDRRVRAARSARTAAEMTRAIQALRQSTRRAVVKATGAKK